ncbi:MAG: hypothetical protein GY950_29545 [bacterium]|nr:hypothetical protein [bacterium]
MNNHYHLILQNTSGKLSDFFRHLNSKFGMYYRQGSGNVGYVFQKRFTSTLIQNDEYLKTAIGYLLLNPIRVGIVQDYSHYIWSSGRLYCSDEPNSIVDTGFVEELFGSRTSLIDFLSLMAGKDLPVIETRFGEVLGKEEFLEEAVERFNRRQDGYGLEMQRLEDRFFEPVAKIIWEFGQEIGHDITKINVTNHEGKRLRGELLVRLKDWGGLTYGEINKIPPFDRLKQGSLGKLYLDAKARLKEDDQKK